MTAAPGANAAGVSEQARKCELQAVELRLAGTTYAAIADAVRRADGSRQYANATSARRAVQRAVAKEYALGAEQREQLRQMQLAQLDRMQRGSWAKALQGDHLAALTVIRCMDRRARLLGLDAPIKLAQTTELDAEIEQLMEQLADVRKQQPASPEVEA